MQILTPEDPQLHGSITSFRLRGRTSHEDNVELAKTLLDKYRIFTVHRDGLSSGSCVRVTPALATPMSDCDALAAAIRALATIFVYCPTGVSRSIRPPASSSSK